MRWARLKMSLNRQDGGIRDRTAASLEYIEILYGHPSSKHQNSRFAGSDLTVGDRIVEAGEVIQPKHIMSLCSLWLS
jgi:molybdopterin biosynthesis enzyme